MNVEEKIKSKIQKRANDIVEDVIRMSPGMDVEVCRAITFPIAIDIARREAEMVLFLDAFSVRPIGSGGDDGDG